jgi:hypothetical protein
MTSHDISEYDAQFRQLDIKLKPLGDRVEDTNRPRWKQMIAERPHPLDEAQVRAVADHVLTAVTELYVDCPELREPIRAMFTRYRYVGWTT